jgi:superfamily II DNA or RNA helicase
MSKKGHLKSNNRKTGGDFKLIYPEHGDKDFSKKITDLTEYKIFYKEPLSPIHNVDEFESYVKMACSGFEKTIYQHFVQHYISRRSPYKSLLLYHGLGSGKSCSSITIAEALLLDHNQNEPPKILVISPASLQTSFEEQIFSYTQYFEYGDDVLKNQCTNDTYRKLVYVEGVKEDKSKVIRKRIRDLIHSRYEFITYEGLVTYLTKHNNEPVTNKVIIVDEAHNLRQNESEKAAADALFKLVENGEQNRLILLSATPMYNEPNEIFWLLSLLIKNDNRSDLFDEAHKDLKLQFMKLFKTNSIEDEDAFRILKILANEYISYIKGVNPFTFPIRFSPKVNNVSIIKDDWAKDIQDGLVPSPLGVKQKGIIKQSLIAGKQVKNSPVLLQLTNITYPGTNEYGEEGFKKIFRRIESDYLQVEYIGNKVNALLPTPDKLGSIASKMMRICDIIRNSEGIVVVYSQFVWAGVIPLAIALEHMGFQRYISKTTTQNILNKSSGLKEQKELKQVKYEGIPIPNYCILSGDISVMGNSKIYDILSKINNPNNINGQKIKVVLMTPVAAEGLNFKNVREIHILDPWYHMNRLEQVIGRTIRTCSHSILPINKRNVTVYLHVTTLDKNIHGEVADNNETADIHAYKISARKLFEMKKAEKIIRDSALDCSLMFNINYFPKDIFQFNVKMLTSQNKEIQFAYGDSIDNKPICDKINKIIKTTDVDILYRNDIYQSMIPSFVSKIRKYIETKLKSIKETNETSKTNLYIPIDEIIDHLEINRIVALNIIETILYPKIIIENYRIYPYKNKNGEEYGLLVEPEKEELVRTEIKLPSNTDIQSVEEMKCNIDNLLSPLNNPSQDYFVATYKLYTDLDSNCWPELAKRCIETRSPIIDRFAEYLVKTGALIAKEELPKVVHAPGQKYIGYVNIFNTNTFEVLIYNTKSKTYIDPTELELKQLKDGRIVFEKPKEGTYGILMPRKNKKNPLEPARNDLKIISAGTTGKGAECITKKWNEINELLDKFGVKKDESAIKSSICFTLGVEMFRKGALLLYPEWKPKMK